MDGFVGSTGLWLKNEQLSETRMTEGLQRDVLRLSTVGYTVDVGKLNDCEAP
jgi:hypothetical protein